MLTVRNFCLVLQGDRCIADGVLLLPPYYFAASTTEGLYTFFSAVIKVKYFINEGFVHTLQHSIHAVCIKGTSFCHVEAVFALCQDLGHTNSLRWALNLSHFESFCALELRMLQFCRSLQHHE